MFALKYYMYLRVKTLSKLETNVTITSLVRIAAAVGTLMTASAASAAIVLPFEFPNVTSDGAVPELTGASAAVTLTFSDISAGQVGLNILVDNTTDTTTFSLGATEADFTGIALDFVAGITGVSLSTPLHGSMDNLSLNEMVGGISNGTPNVGNFSFALSGSGNFEGGGNPSNRLAEGLSGSSNVIFTTTGLTAAEIEAAYQTSLFDPNSGVNVVLRFISINAGSGSDKVLFVPQTSTVPLPAAAWTLIAGLGALGAAARKRRA